MMINTVKPLIYIFLQSDLSQSDQWFQVNSWRGHWFDKMYVYMFKTFNQKYNRSLLSSFEKIQLIAIFKQLIISPNVTSMWGKYA